MSRSLLDTVDLPALRALARDGAAALMAGVLIDTGLLQFDPDDPQWPDRDRLVVGGEGIVAAVSQRLTAAGAPLVPTAHIAGEEALPVALGAAVASRLDGAIWRAWCLVDEAICDDGRTWEAARAAPEAQVPTLTVLVAGAASAKLWSACGWKVEIVPANDPAWLLGALDQALLGRLTAVLVDE